MKVKDAMTKDVITISPDDSLESVIDVFSKNRISGAPVIDDGGRLVGILSESDIIKNVGIKSLLSLESKDVEKIEKIIKDSSLNVGKIMNTKVYSAKEDDDLVEAIKTMNTYDINRLPVVDKQGRTSGILARGDVIRAIARYEATKQEAKLEKPLAVKEIESFETEVDKLLKIIEEKGSITIDKLAKLLNVPEEKVEEWGRTFEEHNLVKLEYPPFGKPVIKKMK